MPVGTKIMRRVAVRCVKFGLPIAVFFGVKWAITNKKPRDFALRQGKRSVNRLGTKLRRSVTGIPAEPTVRERVKAKVAGEEPEAKSTLLDEGVEKLHGAIDGAADRVRDFGQRAETEGITEAAREARDAAGGAVKDAAQGAPERAQELRDRAVAGAGAVREVAAAHTEKVLDQHGEEIADAVGQAAEVLGEFGAGGKFGLQPAPQVQAAARWGADKLIQGEGLLRARRAARQANRGIEGPKDGGNIVD
jgi:hypothetical protein